MIKERFKVNEDMIYYRKIYAYYFTKDLRVNVIPISFYTRLQARLTLHLQFGNNYYKYFRLIKGKSLYKKGWKLGKNSIKINGKRYQIRKFYIPIENGYNKWERLQFRCKLKEILRKKKKKDVNKFLREYYILTYGYRFKI